MGASTTSKRGEGRPAARSVRSERPRKHEVIGVLLVTAALLSLLSLISYSPGDMPLFGGDPTEAHPSSPHNMIGAFGASLAGALFWLIGAGAYLFPVMLLMLGGRCFAEGNLSITIRSTIASGTAVLLLAGLMHLELGAIPTLASGLVQRGMAGGVIGRIIAEGLRSMFASTGAHILVVAGLLVSLLLATPMSLVELWARLPV